MTNISNYVTNEDSDIFCLYNMPEEVIAVLFAYYSRSKDDLRTNLKKLIESGDLDITQVDFSETDITEDYFLKAKEKAKQFHEKYIIGYGHGSVAEHSTVHIAVENVSIYAAKTIEDSRLASYTEKSTRYTTFDSENVYIPEEFNEEEKKAYLEATTYLINTYKELNDEYVEKIKAKKTRGTKQSEDGYNMACQATAFDDLRYLLPISSKTNLGITANARELAHMITKLRSHPLKEIQDIGDKIYTEGCKICPTLIKYAEASDYQRSYYKRTLVDKIPDSQNFANKTKTYKPYIYNTTQWNFDKEYDDSSNYVNLDIYSEKLTLRSLSHYSTKSDLLSKIISDVPHTLWGCTDDERTDIINKLNMLFENRGKFDAAPRELENVDLAFCFIVDYGAWRDIQRHRLATQTISPITPYFGMSVPRYMEEFGFKNKYDEAMQKSIDVYNILKQNNPIAASYVLPLATKVFATYKSNLRNLFHFAELRSTKQGHYSYRDIAQKVYLIIKEIIPELAPHMRVDMEDYVLTRDLK